MAPYLVAATPPVPLWFSLSFALQPTTLKRGRVQWQPPSSGCGVSSEEPRRAPLSSARGMACLESPASRARPLPRATGPIRSYDAVDISPSGRNMFIPLDLELDLPKTDLARCDWPSANILLIPSIDPERPRPARAAASTRPRPRGNSHKRRLVAVGNRALVGHLRAPPPTPRREGRSDGG